MCVVDLVSVGWLERWCLEWDMTGHGEASKSLTEFDSTGVIITS
jgi:hypothetical protein